MDSLFDTLWHESGLFDIAHYIEKTILYTWYGFPLMVAFGLLVIGFLFWLTIRFQTRYLDRVQKGSE